MADKSDFIDKNGKVFIKRLLASLTDAQRIAIATAIRATPVAEDWISDGDGGSMCVGDAEETLERAAQIFSAAVASPDSIFE